MKERAIIFSGEMVKAILDGRKTQTRRVIKPQPTFKRKLNGIGYCASQWDCYEGQWGLYLEAWPTLGRWGLASTQHKCPYGVPGDRLWVRETWCHRHDEHGAVSNEHGNYDLDCVFYRADPDSDKVVALDDDGAWRWNKNDEQASPWRSPIHMPRWASRINLEITNVRVERLQDISEEDSKAEGAIWGYCDAVDNTQSSYRSGFACLWESINGAQSWELNPWVWVIDFRRIGRE